MDSVSNEENNLWKYVSAHTHNGNTIEHRWIAISFRWIRKKKLEFVKANFSLNDMEYRQQKKPGSLTLPYMAHMTKWIYL